MSAIICFQSDRSSPLHRTFLLIFAGSLFVTGLGCGQPAGTTNPQSQASTESSSLPSPESAQKSLPLVAISSQALSSSPENTDEILSATPEIGSPEYHLREIAIIKATPLVPEDDMTPVSDEQLAQRANDRHKKVIDLATGILAKTHSQPEKEMVFSAAVHALSEARLELAIQGDQQQIDLMYDDATSLFKRDPQSPAAATSAFALVKLAEKCSLKDPQDSRWLKEYVTQANLFARSFPQETNRAVVTLINAGKYCELQHKSDLAQQMYSLITELYPNNPLSFQVTGMLRRLSMTGEPLQFSGPTAEGGLFNIDDHKGKLVIINFWKTADPQASQLVSQMTQIQSHFGQSVQIVWVSLDQNESELDKFLETNTLPGQHIFYSNPQQRGLNNPIAKYYGIQSTPAIWLVSQQGLTLTTDTNPQQLITLLQEHSK